MLKKCRVESSPVFCIMRQKSANDYGSKIYEGSWALICLLKSWE